MSGYWPVLFMLIALKVPAIAMIWLLYWASTNEAEDGVLDEGEDDGGSRRKPRPRLPRGPRRAPHGGGAARAPLPRSPRAEPVVGMRVRSGRQPAGPARAREHEPGRS
ncbi:MAG: hypothetical protein KDB48_02310 [Solirubrobacterales bacterium]|nr:hypothetical protein [Solirubrobacterales bacterium]HMT06346.1 hypothetical protein [Solirubrobacterales bacterium]